MRYVVVNSVYVKRFDELNSKDLGIAGGKNASLGEMISALKSKGIKVPEGFATTAVAYWKFIEKNNLKEKIESHIEKIETKEETLEQAGKAIRELFLQANFPQDMEVAIREEYRVLCKIYGKNNVDVAVRSSATAEDLPQASFAGQQESFLNIRGEEELLKACRKCYASLFTDRAIVYREEKGFEHMKVALSVGVQKMVRSDKAGSGVMFTIDTETGFPQVIVINAAWGLGENVVQGKVNPDEYVIFKPALDNPEYTPIIGKTLGGKAKKLVYAEDKYVNVKNVDTSEKERRTFVLNDQEILMLAKWGCDIENHYGKPMDIEWAKDGETGEIFIVQARPETVQSQKKASSLKTYRLREKGKTPLTKGASIGSAIATGKVCKILNAENIDEFEDNSILVTSMTDPDWVPIMKRAAGIITDYGGRTSHAAIVSRELGIPAIVGTGNATKVLKSGQQITLSCAEGENGYVYEGVLDFEESEVDTKDIPKTRTLIMMNLGDPDAATRWWMLPCDGIGLARIEFIINNIIKIHPMALICYNELDKKIQKQIQELIQGYQNKPEYFVDHLARGVAKIAAAQWPKPVIVRMSDFKTNEYANLIGGKQFEPKEANPMLGFRGASRYYSDKYKEGFVLECQAIKRAREKIGMTNVVVMIPFCRTIEEADQVLEVMTAHGLKRGESGLQVYVMVEVPSNVILAEEFAKRFDGFSIGSNDLTQLVLGIDRDSAELSHLFDERNQAVKKFISNLIESARKSKTTVSICGQAPSDYPKFTEFLVKLGIDSISVNPDSVIEVKRKVAETEKELDN